MKFHVLAILAVALITGQLSAQDKPLKKLDPVKKNDVAPKGDLKSLREKASYAYGMFQGNNLRRQMIDFDPEVVARGMKDAASGKTLITDEDIPEIMQKFEESQATAGIKAEEDFLAANKKKEGVVTLPSGLQYKILKKGTGRKPKADDVVTAHYRGTLLNGFEFDSSYKRKKPQELPVKNLIEGWKEALQLMEEGAKWQLFVPSKLAYGEAPDPRTGMPPNAMLIFEMELLKTAAGEAKQPPRLPKLKLPEKDTDGEK